METARAQLLTSELELLRTAAQARKNHDWNAHMRLLERLFPDEFGKRDTKASAPAAGGVNIAFVMGGHR